MEEPATNDIERERERVRFFDRSNSLVCVERSCISELLSPIRLLLAKMTAGRKCSCLNLKAIARATVMKELIRKDFCEGCFGGLMLEKCAFVTFAAKRRMYSIKTVEVPTFTVNCRMSRLTL